MHYRKWLTILLVLTICIAGSGYAASRLNLFMDIPFGIDANEYVRRFADMNLVMKRLSQYKVVMGDDTKFSLWGYPIDYTNATFNNGQLTFIEVGFKPVNNNKDNDQYIDAFEDLSNRLNEKFSKFDYRIMTLNYGNFTFPYDDNQNKIRFDEIASVTTGQDAYSVSLYWTNVSLVMSKEDGVYLNPVLRFQNDDYPFESTDQIEYPKIYNG